jgi:aminobenzoyl-glutamate utilization protein B
MQNKKRLLAWIDQNQPLFTRLSDQIWDTPEIAMKEFRSSKMQAEFMQAQGFRITWDAGGLNTAFIAEWGEGKPIIGFLGEFDALLNLSQKRLPVEEPLTKGGLGHGCGHNLLGVGGIASVVALKEWLQASGTQGTIRYYGCPAEESGDGKVFMARAGVFDDLDAAFNFHPSDINTPSKGSTIGVKDVIFRFHGTSSHAGGSPHLGRSALDAVELMNVGVNYLREHVTKYVRIHYTITHGGDLPNVVPSEAESWYFIRAHKNDELEEVTQRVHKIAQGAALMTETRLEEIFQGGCSSLLSNHYLADLQYEAMKFVGPINFTAEEQAFAQQVVKGYPQGTIQSNLERDLLPKHPEVYQELKNKVLCSQNYPALDEGEVGTGSTDVGDVSQITPLSLLSTACMPLGLPGHTWGVVASSGTSIGHKGMLHAAKIMALAAMDCYSDPIHLQKALQEFEEALRDNPYSCPIPDEVQPRQYPNPVRK